MANGQILPHPRNREWELAPKYRVEEKGSINPRMKGVGQVAIVGSAGCSGKLLRGWDKARSHSKVVNTYMIDSGGMLLNRFQSLRSSGGYY